jgi:hypothetical protein
MEFPTVGGAAASDDPLSGGLAPQENGPNPTSLLPGAISLAETVLSPF